MNELDKLREMLRDAGIPFEDYQEKKPVYNAGSLIRSIMTYGKDACRYSRNQIIYGRNPGMYWKFDAICQYGSCGVKDGLIETYGELGTDPDGKPRVMTAEEAFEIIKNEWERCKNND